MRCDTKLGCILDRRPIFRPFYFTTPDPAIERELLQGMRESSPARKHLQFYVLIPFYSSGGPVNDAQSVNTQKIRISADDSATYR